MAESDWRRESKVCEKSISVAFWQVYVRGPLISLCI